MKKIFCFFTVMVVCLHLHSQIRRVTDHRTVLQKQTVMLYEGAGFSGQAKSLSPGQHLLSDFNDMASSIKVPAGIVVAIYEHGTATQGYGIWVDLLEDCTDLSVYNFNDKVSYVNVFYATKDNLYDWVRNAIKDGQFIPGHWERKKAKPTTVPANTVAVVAPPIAAPLPTEPSVLAVSGATTTITSLGVFTTEGKSYWETAKQQMGVIGNDFRGREEIGTACFERDSNNFFIPDNFNFWYPQRPANDHRPPAKKTLSGKVIRSDQANIQGTYADFDVNIDIVPYPNYAYLLNTAHKPEFTTIMKLQDIPYDVKDCPPSFDAIEAEIAEDYWPKGDHTFGRARLTDMALKRVGKGICVYGLWIYDMGHCCHPEIHPAEQIWWQDTINTTKQYNLNVLCDASRRFWWRKQMDDGTKLKPWAEPPIKGLFAIAFEYSMPKTDASANVKTKQFEANYIDHYNLTEYSNANQTYSLVYQGKTIVTFKPNNNAFKVSFEQVGIAPDDPSKIKGFLVLETEVGKLSQIATSISVFNGSTPQIVKLPANSTPDKAPQQYEDKFFKKEEGHYYFTVTEKNVSSGGPGGMIENIGRSN